MSDTPVVVVGGGWAGLAAAVELCRNGVPVTLLEAARQVGGRARAVRHGELRVDNGQHILLGACKNVLALLQQVGVDPECELLHLPLTLHFRSRRGSLHIGTRALPPPLHLLAGLLSARGLSMLDRWRLARLGYYLLKPPAASQPDIAAHMFLRNHGQTPDLIHRVWSPLCLAALNTPVETASARLFVRVLHEAFSGDSGNSTLLLSRHDLGGLLPVPALDFIERHAGHVLLNHRAERLDIQNNRMAGVHAGDRYFAADQVILATHPSMCRRLLSPHPALHGVADRLARLTSNPICTIYLQYPPACTLELPTLGLHDGTVQWLFDRAICAQPGLIAAVISGPGAHMRLDNPTLSARAAADVAVLYPEWPAPSATFVVREKRATFAAAAGCNALRPEAGTPVYGCWLAGDYTATGLPATLEGAVRSGVRAARLALANRRSTPAGLQD